MAKDWVNELNERNVTAIRNAQNTLAEAIKDSEEMKSFRRSKAYCLICEYIGERAKKAEIKMFDLIDNCKDSEQAMHGVYLAACELKAQKDLVGFFDAVDEIGRLARNQLEKLNSEEAKQNETEDYSNNYISPQ